MLAISVGDLAGVRSARSLVEVAERKHEQCLLNSKANIKAKVSRVIYWGEHKQEILTQAKSLLAKEDLEGIKNIYNTYALNDDTELELIKPEIDALENKLKKRIAEALPSDQVQVAQSNQTEWPKPADNLFTEQPRALPETTKLVGQSHTAQLEQTEWPKPPDNLFVGQPRVSPLLETAKACTTAQECVGVMLSAVEPLQQEIVHLAASQLSNLPKPIRGDRKAARLINQRGIELLSGGANEEALHQFIQAHGIDLRDVEIQSNLGLAYVLTNKASEAKQALISSLLLDPRRTSAWSPLAEAYDLEGNSNNAVASLLLAYEFSSNREKTIDYFKLKADTAARPTMRSAYVGALRALEQRMPKVATQ